MRYYAVQAPVVILNGYDDTGFGEYPKGDEVLGELNCTVWFMAFLSSSLVLLTVRQDVVSGTTLKAYNWDALVDFLSPLF